MSAARAATTRLPKRCRSAWALTSAASARITATACAKAASSACESPSSPPSRPAMMARSPGCCRVPTCPAAVAVAEPAGRSGIVAGAGEPGGSPGPQRGAQGRVRDAFELSGHLSQHVYDEFCKTWGLIRLGEDQYRLAYLEEAEELG